jgi:hypothetical protein
VVVLVMSVCFADVGSHFVILYYIILYYIVLYYIVLRNFRLG